MKASKKRGPSTCENAPQEIAPAPRLSFEYVLTDDLIPYARNSRKHSPEQVAQIAASLKEFGFVAPVVIDKYNGIIAGHGRILAAQKIGLVEVPAVRAEHLTDAQRRAYVIVDNRLAETSSWDKELLALELGEIARLAPDIAIGDIGFSNDELTSLEISLGGDFGPGESKESIEDKPYSSRIESPIYTPQGPCPAIAEVFDLTKTKELLSQIESSSLSEEQKDFLRWAAYRHTVFDFTKIAELYAHSDAEMQEHMENSALVIIDYNKAIDCGFVKLTETLAEAFKNDKTRE